MNFDRQWVVGYSRQRLEEVDQVRYKQLLRDTFREAFRFEQSIQTLPAVSPISRKSSLIAPYSFNDPQVTGGKSTHINHLRLNYT